MMADTDIRRLERTVRKLAMSNDEASRRIVVLERALREQSERAERFRVESNRLKDRLRRLGIEP